MNAPIEKDRPIVPRLVLTITREEDERGLEELLDTLQIPIFYQCRGKGTAPSEMLDIFGLSGTTRLLTINLVPKFLAEELLHKLEYRFSLRRRGTGISLTLPITALQSPVMQMLKEEVQAALEERMEERTERDMAQIQEHGKYTVIWASVASGYADDAVEAARAAGATGGTILKGRRKNSPVASVHLGVSAQEEQEFVMIIVPREQKQAVMSAVVNACGLASPAHGVVLSLPVEDAIGLEGQHQEH